MVSELVALVSWMLGAMHQQGKARSARARKTLPRHYVFPVCQRCLIISNELVQLGTNMSQTIVISFQPRARARVLHGYFDGTLKVLMSGHLHFDVPDYSFQMDALLKWSWPTTCGLTTRILPLPTIIEREENELAVGEIKKPTTSAASIKRRWKKLTFFASIYIPREKKATAATH